MIYRLIDIILILILLPIILPVLLVLISAALIMHKKNIFFTQARLGKEKKVFLLVKFRTMVIGAQNMGTGLYSFENDNRITPFGKILRMSSLDELPQLYNILIGDTTLYIDSGN